MKKIFILAILGSTTVLSADYSCPSCDGGGYYQGQGSQGQGNYKDQGYYQGQGYQARSDQSQRQGEYYQGQSDYNQGQANRTAQYQNTNAGASVSDADITKNIHDNLGSGWFSKGFEHVTAEVRNGDVTLRGSVETIDDRNKVEENVRKINGVKQVENQITIVKTTNAANDAGKAKMHPQDYAQNEQDKQINAKIRNKLSSGWFSKGYETLIIKTTNGVVVISGTVDDFNDIQKVNDQLKDVEGVRTINNQLTVKNK